MANDLLCRQFEPLYHSERADSTLSRDRRSENKSEIAEGIKYAQRHICTHKNSRQARPNDMNEVHLLQQALAPTFRTFFRVTAREPPFVDPWKAYADQTRILQDCSDEHWIADNRRGLPPRLAKLSAWAGGTTNYCTTDFVVCVGGSCGGIYIPIGGGLV